jgi:hypothetical protein
MPPPDWYPDPAWPPAPPGWPFYVDVGPSDDLGYSGYGGPGGSGSRAPARPWFRRKRVLLPLGVVLLLGVGSALNDPEPPLTVADSAGITGLAEGVAGTQTQRPTGESATASPSRTGTRKSKKARTTAAPTKARTKAPARPKVTVKPKPKPKPKPKKTSRSNCDPNYGNGCVPIASDVDCAGGRGNGPAYFSGVATVIGSDIYDLDRDNDGYACEPA